MYIVYSIREFETSADVKWAHWCFRLILSYAVVYNCDDKSHVPIFPSMQGGYISFWLTNKNVIDKSCQAECHSNDYLAR